MLGALGASIFLLVMSGLTDLFWITIPAALGFDSAPWWWVPPMLLIGAGLVIGANRLFGPGMGSPLEGFHFDVGPSRAVAALSVALATLVFGAVLGPEAPLIVCGTVIAGWVTRHRDAQTQHLAMALGGIAAIGAILGNPFIAAFMVLEFAAMGAMPKQALIPMFVALGAGYLVEVGLGPFAGLGEMNLAVPGLTEVDQLTVVDLVIGLAVAICAGVAALIARQVGFMTQKVAKARPAAVTLVAAVTIAILAVLVMVIFDQPYDAVLFSGETGMPMLLAETSAVAVLAIVVAKALAYGLSLGSSFRGGPIFPATYIGVGVAVLVGLIFTGVPLGALVVAGIAASCAAMLKLPFTSGLLAILIAAGAGTVVTPLAILGAIVGLVLRLAYDRATHRENVAVATE